MNMWWLKMASYKFYLLFFFKTHYKDFSFFILIWNFFFPKFVCQTNFALGKEVLLSVILTVSIHKYCCLLTSVLFRTDVNKQQYLWEAIYMYLLIHPFHKTYPMKSKSQNKRNFKTCQMKIWCHVLNFSS